MSHELALLIGEIIGFIERWRIVLLFLVSLLLGAGGGWLIAGIHFRDDLLDHPKDRSSHKVPTPRGGGVGILVAFIVVAVTLRLPTTFIFAAVLISVVSLYSDFFRLSVRFRLVVQFSCALLFLITVAARLSLYYDVSAIAIHPVMLPLILAAILVFIVGTANFFNFMDGINGIAGVSGIIAFGLLGLYNLNQPLPDSYRTALSLLSICMAFSCLGFLPFNLPRARVFVGDVGSILLGFLFAALVVALARNFRDMICFTALLFPFYADALTTLYLRFRAGENLFKPHRRHLYQLLANECGIAHWKVTISYGAVQLIVGAAVLAGYAIGIHVVLLVFVISFLLFTGVTYRVRKKIESLQETALAE